MKENTFILFVRYFHAQLSKTNFFMLLFFLVLLRIVRGEMERN